MMIIHMYMLYLIEIQAHLFVPFLATWMQQRKSVVFSVKCHIFIYDMRMYMYMYIIYISNTLCNIIFFRISTSVYATTPMPRGAEKGWRRRARAILVEYFYSDGSPLFLRWRQMTDTPQNFIKNVIFKPQFSSGDVKMALGDVIMALRDVKL